MESAMRSDLEIARDAKLKTIAELLPQFGLESNEVDFYGAYKAKVSLSVLDRVQENSNGKLIVVSAITPTPLGEGKTVTTVGLSQAIGALNESVFTCIRQPSMGPIFGIKGGAAGGGHSQVVPMEDFNLHLTGDIHAISAAHNLGAAALDSRLYHEERKGYEDFESRTGLKALKIDKNHIVWKRVVDMNDRALRTIDIGLQSLDTPRNMNAIPRQTGFDISVASELMAILALVDDLQSLRKAIGKAIMAYDIDGNEITAEDLGVAGAMSVIMKETIKPTLMQTLGKTPCFIHAGPFANIAHGNSSIIADRIALKLADYVVTEAGFGSDMGLEKFVDIKTRRSGNKPSCVVLVATVRALKMHSGNFRITPGQPLAKGLIEENLEDLEAGLCNLGVHIENAMNLGIPVVVAINQFPTDSTRELARIKAYALEKGASDAQVSRVHAEGGKGGEGLAKAVIRACQKESELKFIYDNQATLKEKIEAIATKVYRAINVSYTPQAEAQLAALQKKYGSLPVCVAKTPLSLSADPTLKGAPTGFTLPVHEVKVSAGAGFVYLLTGKVMTMPGLGSMPSYLSIDIDDKGDIVGLF
jgi:formate--tetrahydrofolate ligase